MDPIITAICQCLCHIRRRQCIIIQTESKYLLHTALPTAIGTGVVVIVMCDTAAIIAITFCISRGFYVNIGKMLFFIYWQMGDDCVTLYSSNQG